MPALENVMYTLFAQDAAPEPGLGWLRLALPVLVIGFLFYFMMIKPERSKQNRHRRCLKILRRTTAW